MNLDGNVTLTGESCAVGWSAFALGALGPEDGPQLGEGVQSGNVSSEGGAFAGRNVEEVWEC